MESQTTHAVKSEQKRNQAVYERLKQQLEDKYWGRFVVIAEGRLIADAPTFEEVVRKADQIVPGATHRIVFRVGEVYPKEVTIGSSDVRLQVQYLTEVLGLYSGVSCSDRPICK